MNSEEKIESAASYIVSELVDNVHVQNQLHEVAQAEMQNIYGGTWSLDEAAESMHPSENHYFSVYTNALNKVLALATIKLRHFSNDLETA